MPNQRDRGGRSNAFSTIESGGGLGALCGAAALKQGGYFQNAETNVRV